VPALLHADGLTVARGRTVLLEPFSVQLSAGELVHLRGGNGSGKSSLLRVLAGVVEPRRGAVLRTVRCAFVPERIALPESLPARRWLRVCGAGERQLPPELDHRCGALSNGQLQRVVLTVFLNDRSSPDPCLYILDEPWSGLDAAARDALDARLSDVVQRGSAAIYTDHGHQAGLAPTRTLDLGGGRAAPDGRVRIELRRGTERVLIVISHEDLAARVSDGWEVERIDSVQ
jgi:ABC-type transport system involved in cytochrome c biogenesis ATPase subunit